ncbi:flagellar export protein FliJ [Alkalibacillus sp. S2W]|uniref:flagellar export protein FliJ n=1 Tax=Alkalibacillus sp. S2W TaxID=3386553 RepID=UPI00398C8FD2
MNDLNTFQKLYQVREQELDDARSNYNRAVDHFETEANKLYELLKSKEGLEKQLDNQMTSGIKVDWMTSYYNYFNLIQDQESDLQKKVHQARLNMYKKQDAVQAAHQELKKINKIIDNKKEKQHQLNKQAELEFLDEIAVQHYSRAK